MKAMIPNKVAGTHDGTRYQEVSSERLNRFCRDSNLLLTVSERHRLSTTNTHTIIRNQCRKYRKKDSKKL